MTPFIRVKELSKTYRMKGRPLRALNPVSFDLFKGETLALVGESGCGKSTLGRALLRLHEPTSGQVLFEGVDICSLSKAKLKPYRAKMQMIFQDPHSSFDPRMTVGEILAEPLIIHGVSSGRSAYLAELLAHVGMDAEVLRRFPHEFSGGQRQRLGIARALALRPEFLVCDEAVSALDVSIQAQITNLLKRLQQEMGLAYLFIAHQLAVVKHIAHRVAVMYLGDFMELAQVDELFANPLHPYTQALLAAIPVPDPSARKAGVQVAIKGDLPSPFQSPAGCPFHTRCPFAKDVCRHKRPEWKEVSPGHYVACHLHS